MKLTGVDVEQAGVIVQNVPMELESPEGPGQLGFRECLTDLRNGWESMTSPSRILFLGSGVVSAAVFGYVTAKCGPIPSLRKMVAGLPEYVGPENRAWLRYSAVNVLSTAKRSVNPGVHVRRRAGLLAGVVMAAANFSPADVNPIQTLPQTAIISLLGEEPRRANRFLGNK